MNKKIIIIILLILCLVTGITIYFTTAKTENTKNDIEIDIPLDSIKDRQYNKIGNNLYYEDELIETKWKDDKDTLFKYYEIISQYMEDNFKNTEFYIYNLNYDVDKIYFNGYQMIDMVMIEDASFMLTFNDNDIKGIYFGNHNFINRDINTDNIINVEEVKQKALDIVKPNFDKIFNFIDNKRELKGECYLSYDKEQNLCYMIVLNHGSYVKINAKTGKVMDTYFTNGIVY